MNRRLILLDIALAALVVFGIAKLRQDWLAFDPLHDTAAIQPLPENLPTLPATNSSPSQGENNWIEIASSNPFSFDRNDIAIVAPVEEPKQVGPRPILFGVMNLGEGPVAMLASAGNRISRPMKIGEIVEGWTIVEILDKSIVVEANSIRQTVIMNDPTAGIPREHTRTLASAPAPSQVIQATARQAPAAASGSMAPSPSSNTGSAPAAEPAMEEIHTPFGVVRRPAQGQPPRKQQ